MDKRIAIPAGLALLVALAVVGMLSLLNWTATQTAEADISPATKIQYRMSDRGLGQTSVHTIGPFQTSVALDTSNNIRLVYPTGHGFTIPSTGAVTVNGVAADAITVAGDTVDIDLGTQSIAADTDITVVLPDVTNTATFSANLVVTVSDGTVAAPGTALGAAAGTTQPLPISPLSQAVLEDDFLPSALQNPTKPGAQASYTMTFITPSNLVNGVDEIVITFADDYVVPTTIDRNQISISADAVLLSGGGPNGSANEAVAPLEVSVDFVSFQGSEQDEAEVTIRVPDMASGDVTASVGGNGIQAGAKVTIIFRQSAGIKNPTESSSQRIDLRTSRDLADVELFNPENGKRVFTPLIVEMSSEGDPRGENVTVVALGVEGGQTSTFWLDQDGDGVRDQTERDLCNVVATSGDVATCSFNVSNPPFEPGFNIVGGSCDAGALVGCNFINVVDGESRVTTGALSKTPLTKVQISRQTFELEPSVSLSPADINVGDTTTVSLFDYPAGNLGAKSIFIAGLDATPTGFSQTIPSSGERSFGFEVPGRANNDITRIPTGTQRFEVFGPGGRGSPGVASQDTDITIAGARLTLSHASVVANQDLTITGSGFTDGNDVCVVEGDVTINNVAVEIDDDDDCDNDVDTRDGIKLSSGGTFTMTVRVEDRDLGSNTPINTALLTEGSVELKIIDTSGAEGTLLVDILPREISVNPASARPRDVVTIIGRAFVADNSDGVSTTIDIEYQCGNDSRSVTGDPDASGNFRETLRIPSNCSIPSTNTITATINANGDTGVVETITHEIPEALVRIEPVRGAPGDLVTVSGEGFRTFETVDNVEFGDLKVLGGRTVNTDGNGDFSVTDVVVPGEDPGIHAVKVVVGSGNNETTASTSFEILESSGFEGSAVTGIEEALAPLFESDTLDRVFFFNNVTKEWNFFINDDAFSSANDLDDIPSGRPIWIKVTEDTSVELNGQPFDLTCVNAGTPEEDCWNLIVFP